MSKIFKRLKSFLSDAKLFGLTIALTNMLWPLITKLPGRLGQKIMDIKHREVFSYIDEIIGDSIHSFVPANDVVFESENAPVWVCWLQGEGDMPELVKLCLAALRRNAGLHPVIVVSLQNFREFCTVPDYILNNYEEGKIIHAHFADIIRTCLLYEKGGAWIDATLLTTRELPEELFESRFYSCKTENKGLYVTEYRWSNFFLCAPAHTPMYEFVRMCFFEYLYRQSAFVDYFMMDYFMALGYNLNSLIRQDVDKLPYNNENIHSLYSRINNSCTPVELDHFFNQETCFFKLSWKCKYLELANGSPTYYKLLKQKYLQ